IEDTLWPGVGGKPSTLNIGNGTDWINPNTGDDALGALAMGGFAGSIRTNIFSLNTATTVGSGVNDFVTVNGNLNPNSAVVLINPLSPLTAGNTYTLITYSGALNSFFGAPNVINSLRPSHYAFTVNQGGGVISLTVNSGPGVLKWNNSATTGLWDITNSLNWFDTSTSSITNFDQLDLVTFDDTYVSGPTNAVTIATTVNPGTITINTANIYTFSGAGKIAGTTTLEKDGTGSALLGTANTFSGDVTINAGTLILNNRSALGSSSSGTLTIANGATLDLAGSAVAANTASVGGRSVVVSGSGVNGNGAIVNNGPTNQYNSPVQNVTLTGDTTFGGSGQASLTTGNTPGRWDIRGAAAALNTSGNAYNLYKVGSNQVSLVGATIDPALADIDIKKGMLGFETTSTSMGNPTNTLTIENGGILEFYQTTNLWNKLFVVLDGGMIDNASQTNVIVGPITLSTNASGAPGNALFRIAGNEMDLNNVVSGPGNLVMTNSTGSLVLNTNNTYTGNTVIAGGTLVLSDNGSINNSTNIVLSGGSVDVSVRNTATLTLSATSGQALSGSGTLNGSLVSAAGTLVSPGTTSALGTLTVSNNVSLAGTTVLKLNAGSLTNDLLNVSGNLTIGGTLSLTNLTGSLAGGQSFKLFNAATYTTNYTAIVPATPGPNLAWDVSMLASNGTLAVVSTGPAPTPQITGISLNGTTLTISATNGSVGGQYTLLQSTNIALPLSQWTPVLTNNFDNNGDLNLSTNIVDPNNNHTFYILQAP
ncbi:MAG TPA: autotransporter-associated beta strand repeat-containing protein, partial [Desulfuromonadaceae bacterium]|nr:autotransporter-associated beta strand repeat-containing protein [Desulfuromonadaceae bacterium]